MQPWKSIEFVYNRLTKIQNIINAVRDVSVCCISNVSVWACNWH